MNLLGGVALLLVVALVLLAIAILRKPREIPGAVQDAGWQIAILTLRVPLALLSAAFVSNIVPAEAVAALVGPETNLFGIVIASAIGALVPGGPVLTFPLALVVWRAGAGEAQMVAFLTAWSIFAVHRIVSFEIPLLGWRFVMLRLASSWPLPFVAGIIVWVAIGFLGYHMPP